MSRRGRGVPASLDRILVRALGPEASWLAGGIFGSAITLAPLALVTVLLVLLGDVSLVRTATVFFITLSVVLGFQVFTGNSGVFTFGHVAFMGVAAYVCSLLTMAPADKATLLPHLPAWLTDAHLDFWLAAPLTLATMGVLALLIGIPLVRLSGSAAAIATLGLLIITNVVLAGAKDFTNGASTFFGVPPITTIGLTFGWAAVALVVARLFRESVPGLQLRASREDELASRSSAVDVTRVRLLAWVIGAVIASGAGILLAHYLTAFSPRQFYLAETFNVLAMLIVGGSASVSGAVSGALAVTVAFEVLRRIEDSTGIFGLTGIFVGVLILVALFRRREGLVGLLEIDERIMGRWRVRRPRIETPPPA